MTTRNRSTVHKDISERLARLNPMLYKKVRGVLDYNKEQRHLRGGLATKKKYRALRREKKTAAPGS